MTVAEFCLTHTQVGELWLDVTDGSSVQHGLIMKICSQCVKVSRIKK